MKKCSDCQKELKKGQEYWTIDSKDKSFTADYCLNCWANYTFEKKKG